MKYILLSPLATFLLFRVIFPIIWCFNYIGGVYFNHLELAICHLIFLLLEGLLIVLLMRFIIVNSEKNRLLRIESDYVAKKKKEGRLLLNVGLFGAFIFILFNFGSLPILMDRGSDSMVELVIDQKIQTWISYGLLNVFSLFILFALLHKDGKNYLLYFILLLTIIVTGKKSALISFFSIYVFLYYIYSKKPSLPFRNILIVISLALFFIILQFIRTTGFDFEYKQAGSLLSDIVFSSSTSYLEQIISLDGIKYAQQYASELGTFGPLTYIFHPFIKFFFGSDFKMSIGPFLNYQIYGSDFPNGVNPTLFFETIFVFGEKIGIVFAFVNLFVVFWVAKILIKRVIYDENIHSIKTVAYYLLFLSCFSFLLDTLNTIRDLPFAIFPFIIYKANIYLSRYFKGTHKKGIDENTCEHKCN